MKPISNTKLVTLELKIEVPEGTRETEMENFLDALLQNGQTKVPTWDIQPIYWTEVVSKRDRTTWDRTSK